MKLFDAPLVESDEGDGPPKARAEEALDPVGRPGRASPAEREQAVLEGPRQPAHASRSTREGAGEAASSRSVRTCGAKPAARVAAACRRALMNSGLRRGVASAGASPLVSSATLMVAWRKGDTPVMR